MKILYYAAKQLAPPKYGAFLSWVVGWLNWLSQITAAPSIDYACSCMILALRTYNSKDNVTSTNGEIYGLTMGLMCTQAIISSFPTKWLAIINSLSTISNTLFLLIVLIMILAGNKRSSWYGEEFSDYNSNTYAWALYNQTEFPDGIAMMMAFLGCIWSLSGYDSPFHLAEECSNANISTPRAIVLSAGIGGVVGWGFMILISYTIFDINKIASDSLGQPFVSYLSQILPKKQVNVIIAFTIISSFLMGCSSMLAASRVTFSYSRDGCFPLSRYWKMVNQTTKTPVNAVWIDWLLGESILLLIFAGPTAIGAIFSVGAIGSFVSFTLPTLFKITYSRKTFKRGP